LRKPCDHYQQSWRSVWREEVRLADEFSRMSWNLAFWIYAFCTMTSIVALIGLGVRTVRRGHVRRHRRFMMATVAVVVVFLFAYAIKVIVLGREDKSDWSSGRRVVLYVHEACVLTMLVSGGVAMAIGRRIFPRFVSGDVDEPASAARRRHARYGRICVAAAVLALLWGAVVLLGMVAGG
jgi:uncharacterized membrane protein YozB (DUF420 family)